MLLVYLMFTLITRKIGEEGDLDPGDLSTSTELNSTVLEHHCPPELKDLSLEDIVVWVDPLDGTKEFTEVCLSI